ncbi:MAG: hypothetical protein NVSMB9_20380 [Isosphaeraceae bacterium]
MKEVEKNRIPVPCPNVKCDFVGWILLDHLDRQLICRSCGTRFHMDGMGSEMRIGERPQKFEDPFKVPPPPKYRPNIVEMVEKLYNKIPARHQKRVKQLTGVLLLAVLASLTYVQFFRPGPKLPESLPDRALYVVKALARNDREKIKNIADPATLKDLEQWVKRARPASWPRSDFLPRATVKVGSQNMKKGKAFVVARIEPIPAAASPSPPAPEESEAGKEKSQTEEGKTSPSELDEHQDGTQASKEELSTPEPEKPDELLLNWVFLDEEWWLDLTASLANIH